MSPQSFVTSSRHVGGHKQTMCFSLLFPAFCRNSHSHHFAISVPRDLLLETIFKKLVSSTDQAIVDSRDSEIVRKLRTLDHAHLEIIFPQLH